MCIRDRRNIPASGGSGDEAHGIHLPQASYWPIVVSLGIFIAAYGVVFNNFLIPWSMAIIGTFIGFVGVYAWSLEPVNDPDEETGH